MTVLIMQDKDWVWSASLRGIVDGDVWGKIGFLHPIQNIRSDLESQYNLVALVTTECQSRLHRSAHGQEIRGGWDPDLCPSNIGCTCIAPLSAPVPVFS